MSLGEVNGKGKVADQPGVVLSYTA